MESKSVISMLAIQCPPETEEKFNRWYNEVHIPMLLKNKEIRRVTRYKRLSADEEYPNYLTIYEFDSKEAFDAYNASPELAAAHKERQETWREGGYERKWRVQYEAIKTWQR